MKRNISVNIFGTLYPIDEDAYELLKKYNENMRRYYSRMEDGEEIADDVEHRVAELLSELRAQGVMAITIDHVKEIINRIGDPQEMEDIQPDASDANQAHQQAASGQTSGEETSSGDNPSANDERRQSADIPNGEFNRKLFRDPEDKILGGVLSGLSHYFGIKEPIVLRLLMVILLIMSFSTLTIIYLIAWILIPEAITPEDRLRMYGKPVSAKAINEELMRGVNATSEFVRNPQHRDTARGCLSVAIKIVLICIATFFIFILGSILLAFISAILGLGFAGVAGSGIMIDVFGDEISQIIAFWPKSLVISLIISGLLVICIPLFGLIRALVKHQNQHLSTWAKVSIIGIWCLSLIWLIASCIGLARITDKHFRTIDRNEHTVNGLFLPGGGWETLKKQGWTLLKMEGVDQYISRFGTLPSGEGGDYLSLQAKDSPSDMAYHLSQQRQLRPGTYQIESYVHADGEGNSLYVVTNEGKDTLRIGIPPYVEPENEISNQEVVADSNDPSKKWSHVEGTFVVRQLENVEFGISNESQLSDTPWNGQRIDIAGVKVKTQQ